MGEFARVLTYALVLTLLSLLPAQAEKRAALVIGNAKYLYEVPLRNPPNDAADVANALERLGFTVTRLSDVGSEAMRHALRDFDYEARSADIAIVYFAGHGIEVDGDNYLVPINAEFHSDRDVQYEAVALRSVLSTVETASRLGLVILDACRDNPFRRRMIRTAGLTRSISRGLGRVEPSGNVLVVYAAAEGKVAEDGSSRNSPFTAALLKRIETPGVEIGYLFRLVRDDVLKATHRRQDPPIYGRLGSEKIFLKPGSALPSVKSLPSADSSGGSEGSSKPQAATLALPQGQSSGKPASEAGSSFTKSTKAEDRLPLDTSAPIMQRVVLYEEDSANPQGKRFVGTAVWRLETVTNPGTGNPVIHADVEIPEPKITVKWSLRLNTDKTLPASHTIDIVFTLPPDFPNGTIANIPGILMKQAEQTRGVPLAGLSVKVTKNFFLIALSQEDVDLTHNTELLEERAWLDVPIVYSNGRRAILAIEKGELGDRAFKKAFAAWNAKRAARK